MMRPHPAVEKRMDDEVNRRIEEVMDLIDDWVGAYRDHEYYSCKYGEGEKEYEQKVRQRVTLLVMAELLAETEGATP